MIEYEVRCEWIVNVTLDGGEDGSSEVIDDGGGNL